jgi:hypothetical protein
LAGLEAEFGKELIALIDRAGYFYARDLWEFVSGERRTETIAETVVERVLNEMFQAWYFLPRLPELNPVEQCWNQLEEWFNYRLIDDLSHLQEKLRIAIDEIDELNLFNYLLPPEFESDLETN